MFENQAKERLRQPFRRQFQPDGDGYLYRQNSSGEAIRVTAAEHAEMVADFDRMLDRTRLGSIALAMLVSGVIVTVAGSSDGWLVYAGMAAVVGGVILTVRHLWNAPARALRGRPVVRRPLNGAERGDQVLSRLSWSQVALGVAGALVLLGIVGFNGDWTGRWRDLWLVGGVLLLAVICIQAVRKWRLEHRTRPRSKFES